MIICSFSCVCPAFCVLWTCVWSESSSCRNPLWQSCTWLQLELTRKRYRAVQVISFLTGWHVVNKKSVCLAACFFFFFVMQLKVCGHPKITDTCESWTCHLKTTGVILLLEQLPVWKEDDISEFGCRDLLPFCCKSIITLSYRRCTHDVVPLMC